MTKKRLELETQSTFVSGFTILVAATAIAGIAGYVVTWLVYRTVGPASYANFAIYWSALYLIVGGLSGVQQEITRASSPANGLSAVRMGSAPRFAIFLAAIVALVVAVSSPVWGIQAFGSDFTTYILPLILGTASYAVVAVISGSLYGLSLWYILGSMIAIDALLRLLLVGLVCLFLPVSNLIPLAVAVPFVLTPMFLVLILKRSLLNKVQVDVGLKKLSWNSTRTVSAALLTALLVSGFPLVLGVTSPTTSKILLGELIFVITLTRAPLIVVVSSLQSFFIVRFREAPSKSSQLLKKIIFVVLGVTIILSIPAGLLGLQIFELLTGHAMRVNGWFVVALVISSGFVAVLSITGAALLARSQHTAYVLGWALSAFFTIVFLLIGVGEFARIELALILAPIMGITTHLLFLVNNKIQPNQ